MRTRTRLSILVALAVWLPVRAATAHFLVLRPSTDIVSAGDERTIEFDVVFTHPMEGGPAMEMDEPRQFGVLAAGETHDLRERLTPVKVDGRTAYRATYRPKEPGDYVFFVEPAPYWEQAEGKKDGYDMFSTMGDHCFPPT